MLQRTIALSTVPIMQIEAQIAGESQAYIPAQAVAPFTLQMTLIVPLTLLMFERRPAQSQKDGFRKPHSLPAQFTAQNPLKQAKTRAPYEEAPPRHQN